MAPILPSSSPSPLQNGIPDAAAGLPGPLLLLSTRVGKGNVSIADALLERLAKLGRTDVRHERVEDHLPQRAVEEDLVRYRWIAAHCRPLLHLIYRADPVYRRKVRREVRRQPDGGLTPLRDLIAVSGAGSVIAVSHRPAFWASLTKRTYSMDFQCWGMLTEFGPTIAWKHIFWDRMNGFFSPLPRRLLPYGFGSGCRFIEGPLPVSGAAEALKASPGAHDQVLVVMGYWGQVRSRTAERTVRGLLARPGITVHMVCGTNERLLRELSVRFRDEERVKLYGPLESIIPLLRTCGTVVTKPGMSTLLEAHAAGRQIFLLPGMPVAEAHNASYAKARMGALSYGPAVFAEWLAGRRP